MRSYVVQFCNRAAEDAKEINVFFEGSEKRNFAIFFKFIRKKIAHLWKMSKFTQTKQVHLQKTPKRTLKIYEKKTLQSHTFILL